MFMPTAGSKWKARDGRHLEVIAVHTKHIGTAAPFASLKLLNPKPRQRRETRIELEYFDADGCGFLSPLTE